VARSPQARSPQPEARSPRSPSPVASVSSFLDRFRFPKCGAGRRSRRSPRAPRRGMPVQH